MVRSATMTTRTCKIFKSTPLYGRLILECHYELQISTCVNVASKLFSLTPRWGLNFDRSGQESNRLGLSRLDGRL